MDSQSNLLKKWLDKFLVINFFVVIAGSLLFLIGIISSFNNFEIPYRFFQSLWLPLFLPAISIFFTAVLIEAILTRVNNLKDE